MLMVVSLMFHGYVCLYVFLSTFFVLCFFFSEVFLLFFFFFLLIRQPPSFPLFPYTTLFRSALTTDLPRAPEGWDERLLPQIVDAALHGAPRREKAGERAGMPADQLRRRLLVATLPGGDQRRVGRHDGDGLGWGHASVR